MIQELQGNIASSQTNLQAKASSSKDGQQSGHPILTRQVEPHQQQRFLLSNLSVAHMLKGFAVEVTPDLAGSVETEVIDVGTSDDRKFVLHIANLGNEAITTTVWEI